MLTTQACQHGYWVRYFSPSRLLETLNAEDKLLIVDDVMSSGLNVDAVINRLQSRLKRNMPENIRVAVPWWKPQRSRTTRRPDFYLHETSDWLVMPYELSGLTPGEIQQFKAFLAPFISRLIKSYRSKRYTGIDAIFSC